MIIDTHTHFGDPAYPKHDLYRTAMPETYKALAIPEGVTGTVVVESGGQIEDNQWVIDLAADDPFIVGLVGLLDPFSDQFASDLDRFCASPLFNGFRLHMDCCQDYSGKPQQSKDNISEKLLESLELLRGKDRTLDFHGDYLALDYVAELARRVPGLRLVLNHIVECRPIDGKEPNPQWAQCVRDIARFPNIWCKVSALVQMTDIVPAPADVAFYRPVLDVLWDVFGEDRLIYASNWPQIERVSNFATAHRIVARYFEGRGTEAAEKYFWKNSKVAYQWVDRTTAP